MSLGGIALGVFPHFRRFKRRLGLNTAIQRSQGSNGIAKCLSTYTRYAVTQLADISEAWLGLITKPFGIATV